MGILNQDCVSWLYTSFFLPLYLNLYTNIQPKLPFTKYFSLKQMKQTTHQVSCQSLLNHGIFSAGLYIKQGSPRGSLHRFCSSSLQFNRSIILPFSELMEMESRYYLVLNCLHSTFAVEAVTDTLPPCFMYGARNVTLRRVQSLFLSVLFLFLINNLPDSLRWDKVDDIVSHFLNIFVEIWFLVQ